MNPADAVAGYRSSVPPALDRVRAMSGDQLASPLNLLDMMTTSGVNFLAMALKHSVHHRRQLSTYLRDGRHGARDLRADCRHTVVANRRPEEGDPAAEFSGTRCFPSGRRRQAGLSRRGPLL